MIQILQKVFHTDKWIGRVVFIALSYVLFWFVFYGLPFLIPEDFFEVNNISGSFTTIYALVVVPSLSFFLLKFFRKIFFTQKISLFIIHIFYLILSIALFFGLVIYSASQNINFGGI